MPTMTDNRKFMAMTPEDADKVMQSIARLEIDLAVSVAATDRKIAAIKAKLEEDTADNRQLLNELADILDKYIKAHPERFQKPRARKTKFGNYGMRTVSNLEITDPVSLLDRLQKAKQDDFLTVKTALNLKAIEAALINNQTIDGAVIVSGERSFYKVDRLLIDEATKGVQL